jgi:CheY-like chemotaxis protein
MHLTQVNLNDTVSGLGPMLTRIMRENIRWSTVLGENLDSVMADATQLEQVVMNLAVNASDAMPDGGQLSLATRSIVLDERWAAEHAGARTGRHVMLEMSDTGIGMDVATLNRIFEPFFTTKDIGRGTGLGLATTYAVVTQLGGHITVGSTVGEGTTFRVYLPSVESTVSSAAASVNTTASHAMTGNGALVLLVEDEDGVRDVIRRGLERNGYEVLEAPDGEHGLRLAAEHAARIDFLVTDLMMPGINGRKVADAVALHTPGIRVVFISGYADDTVDREGLIGPARAFLQKPFTAKDLARTIHKLTIDAEVVSAA